MKTLGRTISILIVLSLVVSGAFCGKANAQDALDSTSLPLKTPKDDTMGAKAPKLIAPSEKNEGEILPQKGGYSDEQTGKQILKVKIEAKTQDDLSFLHELGLSCCSGIGVCECAVTSEQANQIRTRRIGIQTESEKKPNEQDERWVTIGQRVDRINLRATEIIMASMQVSSQEDLEFLKEIGVKCCVDTGICKCQITKDQWKQIGFHGFRYGAHVIDTLQWGREAKPKSNKIVPSEPKPARVNDQSPVEREQVFVLKVEIKTGKEMGVIKQVMRRLGGQCESNGKQIRLRFNKEQMDALKNEGIEFEVEKSER
ncbi:MAG: hypothetical protein WCE90_09425 [Candidatus Zixiibacteriota bacterium]